MKKDLLRHLAVVVITLVPVAYLLVKWETIPDIIPIHFDADFEADRYAPKGNIWGIVAIMAGTSLLTYLLLENLHIIDPKRSGKELPVVFKRLSTGMAMFLSALCLLVIMSCINTAHMFDRFLLPMIGFLFAFLGNIMYSIKPNYFAGIRVPWTLRDDNNWKLTHQFAGKLWFGVGIVMILAGIFLPVSAMVYVLLPATLLLAVLPILYSYSIHRRTINS